MKNGSYKNKLVAGAMALIVMLSSVLPVQADEEKINLPGQMVENEIADFQEDQKPEEQENCDLNLTEEEEENIEGEEISENNISKSAENPEQDIENEDEEKNVLEELDGNGQEMSDEILTAKADPKEMLAMQYLVDGATIETKAREYLGLKYVSGGTSLQSGADCSGYVCRIFEMYGINLWKWRTQMYKYRANIGTDIGTNTANAQAGDIIVYKGHVGICTGRGTVISMLTSSGCSERTHKQMGSWATVRCIIRPYEVGKISVPAPQFEDARIASIDLKAGTYTVEATFRAEGGVDRTQFPAWTAANGQDDLLAGWEWSSDVRGNVTSLGDNRYQTMYTVRIADHANERGIYYTHVYVYDSLGQFVSYAAPDVNMDNPPEFVKVNTSKINWEEGSYTVSAYFEKDADIKRVLFPTWTELNGQDDIPYDWAGSGSSACEGKRRDYGNSAYQIYDFTVYKRDHNNEAGNYITHIYAYDSNNVSNACSVTKSFDLQTSGVYHGENNSAIQWRISGTKDNYELYIGPSEEGEPKLYAKSYQQETIPWTPYKDQITSLIVGEGITMIDGGFEGYSKLENISLPDSLWFIGQQTFCEASKLKGTLVLPSSITYVKGGAFWCTGIEKVIFTGAAPTSAPNSFAKPGGSFGGGSSWNNIVDDKYSEEYKEVEVWYTHGGHEVHKIIEENHQRFETWVRSGGSFEDDVVIYYDPNQSGWAEAIEEGKFRGYTCYPTNISKCSTQIAEDKITLSVGEKKEITYETDVDETYTPVWESNDPEIVEVSDKGEVTAKAVGSTVVTLRIGTTTATCQVVVINPNEAVTGVEIGLGSLSLAVGEKYSIKASVQPITAGNQKLLWSSDNPRVVEVSEDGEIQGLCSGSATIKVVAEENPALYASCYVTCEQKMNQIIPSKSKVELMSGESMQLSYTVMPENSVKEAILWTSDREDVVTVSKSGVLTAGKVEEDQVATIKLISSVSECSASVQVTVHAPQILKEDEVLGEAQLSGMWIAGFLDEQKYTGKAIKQNVRIYDGQRILQEKRDYVITYANNVKAASASVQKPPKMIVTFKGNYKGKIEKTFDILPCSISSSGENIKIYYKYNGKKQNRVPTVNILGKNLKNKTDFILSYQDSGDYKSVRKDPYIIEMQGIGNYTGSRTYELYIVKSGLLEKAKVSKVPDQIYTGEEICPGQQQNAVKVMLDGEEVDAARYEITYQNNVHVGTATMIISAREESGLFGSVAVNFRIRERASLKKAVVNENVWKDTILYNDEYKEGVVQDSNAKLLKITVNGRTELLGKDDYDLSYINNTKSGTATAVFTGKNGYTGVLKKKFKIKAYDISADENSITVTVKDAVYQKDGVKTETTVSYGKEILQEGIDYVIKYENNKKVGRKDDAKAPTVVIVGKGVYTGSLRKTFTITKQNIRNMELTVKDVTYGKSYKSIPVLKDYNGKMLKAGIDYEKKLLYTHDDIGNGDAIEPGMRYYVTITGKGNYEGTVTGSYRIIDRNIASAKIKILNEQIYTGNYIEPKPEDLQVKIGNIELSTDQYEIISYSNNRKAGKATMVIKGKGEYGGIKKVTYIIKAQEVSRLNQK